MFNKCVWVFTLAVCRCVSAESLSLAEAMDKAVRTSPILAALSANTQSQVAAEKAAGRLPEPRLALGLQNLPVTGPQSWSVSDDSMTMRAVGLIQDVPNRAKRRAEVDKAGALAERATAELHLKTLEVRRDTALAWLGRFYLERQISLLDSLGQESALLEQTASAGVSTGNGSIADSLLPRREKAELDDRRDEVLGELAKAKARLRRWVADASDEPLAGGVPNLQIDAQHLREHVHQHPELAVFEPMTAVAQADIALAEAKRRPDWDVAVMYGHRAAQYGDMLSVQFTVGLPFLARDRTDAELESRLRTRQQVSLERDGMLRDHVAELDADLTDYQTASRQLDRMRTTHLPLAIQQVSLRLAQYQSGSGPLSEVLMARRELIELRLREVETEGKRAAAAAKLIYIYGGELP